MFTNIKTTNPIMNHSWSVSYKNNPLIIDIAVITEAFISILFNSKIMNNTL